MRWTLPFLAAMAAVAAAQTPDVTNTKFEERSLSGDLPASLRSTQATWFGYAIKAVQKDSGACCWNSDQRATCSLEDRSRENIGRAGKTSRVQLEGSDRAAVLLRVENNQVGKIRVFSLDCPLDAGSLPFVWLTGVSTEASLSYLEKLALGDTNRHLGDGAVFAIAQHAGGAADEAMARLASPSTPESVREKTAFWAGTSRGARGVQILQNLIAHDPSEGVRDKAVFGLSVSKQPEATDILIATAKSDASSHVRKQALFWLAQKAGTRAAATLQNAIENDPDTGVKKQAVFAMSQLPKDEGVPKLIEIARSQRNAEVRKQAFFWLGQSNDPRALKFFQDVLSH